jgi:hypothetical protein
MGSSDAAHLSNARRCGNRVPTAAGVVLAVPAAGTRTVWAQARALDAYADTASLASMRLCECGSAPVLEVGNSYARLSSCLHVINIYLPDMLCLLHQCKSIGGAGGWAGGQAITCSATAKCATCVRCSSLQKLVRRPLAALRGTRSLLTGGGNNLYCVAWRALSPLRQELPCGTPSQPGLTPFVGGWYLSSSARQQRRLWRLHSARSQGAASMHAHLAGAAGACLSALQQLQVLTCAALLPLPSPVAQRLLHWPTWS